MRIAIDAMGGDRGPAAVAEGASSFVNEDSETEILLVGQSDLVTPELKKLDLINHPQIKLVHATEFIAMGEKLESVRRKKDASINVAAKLVREDKADGLVAIGNTIAAVAASTLILKRIQGVSRPGIAVPMPSLHGSTVVIDMGANTVMQMRHYIDYAIMASIYAKKVLGVDNPKVGLLNVGEEFGKGNEILREAYVNLKAAPINFIGNVEGGDIFKSDIDVVVCDGVTGNAILKASEGIAELIMQVLKSELTSTFVRKFGAIMTRGAYHELRNQTDYAEFGGAPLLGVKGAVIIGHGRSDARAIQNAIKRARDAAKYDIVEEMKTEIGNLSAACEVDS